MTVRNNSSSVVPLSGWALRAQSKQIAYSFPDVLLRPGESFTLRTQENARELQGDDSTSLPAYQHVGNDHTAVWDQESIWDEQGDSAQLIAPDGSTVASVDVIPTAPKVHEPITSESLSAAAKQGQNANGKCLIM